MRFCRYFLLFPLPLSLPPHDSLPFPLPFPLPFLFALFALSLCPYSVSFPLPSPSAPSLPFPLPPLCPSLCPFPLAPSLCSCPLPVGLPFLFALAAGIPFLPLACWSLGLGTPYLYPLQQHDILTHKQHTPLSQLGLHNWAFTNWTTLSTMGVLSIERQLHTKS